MSKLNLKIKTDLKKQIDKEKQGGKDSRFLNYYNLKEGEKMTILLLPDANGELWRKFSKHGPGLKTPGAGSINCSYKSNQQDCPACKKGFEFLNMFKESGDKDHKEEAKKWFSKDYTLVQCLVLDSPIDIDESPDGNQVKLMYVPFGIENIIKEAVTEGLVPEDELCQTPFVIKKTTNQGGFASYDNSYFSRKTISDDELDVFDEFKIEQYDFDTLDVIPTPTTTEEVQEWLEKAEQVMEGASSPEQGQAKGKTDASSGGTLQDRIKRSREVDNEDTRKIDEDTKHLDQPEQKEEPVPEKEEQKESTGGSSLRDRLKAARQA